MAIVPGAHAGNSTTFASSLSTPAVSSSASGSNFYVAAFSSQPGPGTCTDSFGNLYTQIGTDVTFNGGFKHSFLFKCERGIGGAGHVFTYTPSTGGTLVLYAIEVTGGPASATVDSFSGFNVTSVPYNGTPVTAANANELLLVFAGSQCAGGGLMSDADGAGVLDSVTNGAILPGFSAWRAAPTAGVYNSQLVSVNALDGALWNLLLSPASIVTAAPSYPLPSSDYF